MPPSSSKRTFYPDNVVTQALEEVRPKKLSERVNDLIRKGLDWEREERIRLEYARVDKEFSHAPSRNLKTGDVQTKWLAAESLFVADDSDEDLF